MCEAQTDGLVIREFLTEIQRYTIVAAFAAIHARRIALLVLVVKIAALLETGRNRPAQAAIRALVIELVVVRLPRARVEIDLGAVFFRLLRDDVDDAADSIAAVERRARALHDFDALDVLDGRDARERRARTAHRALVVIEALAIDEHDNALLAVDTHDLVVAARAIRHDNAIDMIQCLSDISIMIGLDVLRRHDFHIGRRIHVFRRDTFGCHNRLTEIGCVFFCSSGR